MNLYDFVEAHKKMEIKVPLVSEIKANRIARSVSSDCVEDFLFMEAAAEALSKARSENQCSILQDCKTDKNK